MVGKKIERINALRTIRRPYLSNPSCQAILTIIRSLELIYVIIAKTKIEQLLVLELLFYTLCHRE